MREAVFWTSPPRPQAVSESRERLRSSCPHLSGPALDSALLLTSEIVSNALRHGEGEITCRLWCGPDLLRLEVSDASPVVPRAVVRGLMADSGRGLTIVEQVASRWGSVPSQREPGKTVWFELDTGLG